MKKANWDFFFKSLFGSSRTTRRSLCERCVKAVMILLYILFVDVLFINSLWHFESFIETRNSEVSLQAILRAFRSNFCQYCFVSFQREWSFILIVVCLF